MKKMQFNLIKNWLGLLGDSRKILSLRYLPGFFEDWRTYKRLSGSERLQKSESFPCLSDRTTHTPFDPHYFFQSVWLSRRLANILPETHIDIGSSIAMVAVVSAYVPTIFIDYRPLNVNIDNMIPIAGNSLSLPFADNQLNSLSSLHVIEHVGLGRYGDQLNPHGSQLAAQELVRVLAPSGRLYVSVPVGRERTQFNAHRVFNPSTVRTMFADLKLVSFGLIDDDGHLSQPADLSSAAVCEYGCGLFEMTKK
jgi:hypothetical protein